MNRTLPAFLLIALLASPAISGAAGDDPDAAFAKLQSLTGDWEGKDSEGRWVRVTYELRSNKSVVVETLESADESTMITVYHRDGKELRMTHFCSAQNQPRMKSSGLGRDGRTISFDFVDATNVAPGSGHMNNLHITFDGDNRITHRWVRKQDGKTTDNVFELTRRK